MFVLTINLKRVCVLALGLILLVLLIIGGAALFKDNYVSAVAAAKEINKYEIRTRLLMDAMNQIGVCTPEGAAEVWAKGVKSRSAAMQYSVMTGDLKAEYAEQLDTTAPNWVTGVSSPWVSSFEIGELETPTEGEATVSIRFSTATSAGPYDEAAARLTLVEEGGFWRISRVDGDKGLCGYTGFECEGE